MANWVYNEMAVEGDDETVKAFVKKLAEPVLVFNSEEEKEKTGEVYSLKEGKALSFLNVTAPEDWDEYSTTAGRENRDNPLNWYNWNIENWGTKWDALHAELSEEAEGYAAYTFETAWSPPDQFFEKASEQWPTLTFRIAWEEEQGYGAIWEAKGGVLTEEEAWDIPDSHADFVARDKEFQCVCQYSSDEEEWFDDCPRE